MKKNPGQFWMWFMVFFAFAGAGTCNHSNSYVVDIAGSRTFWIVVTVILYLTAIVGLVMLRKNTNNGDGAA